MSKTSKKPVAIITGGSGYVGRAIAVELLRRNWQVILASRKPAPLAKAETVTCDITDETSVKSMVKTVVKKYGIIDACIHAAAASVARMPLMESSAASFDEAFAVSVRGAYLLAREARHYMHKRSAFIGITTHSLDMHDKIERNIGAHLPAKQALRGLLRVLSYELESSGIRVYAVAPGFLPGGLNNDLPSAVRTLLARQDDGTSASAEDVAEIVGDLCTNPASFASGTSITSPERIVTPL